MSVSKVVLAYSGGLDTSAIVPWLKENYGCEVVAFVADVGQGAEELEGVEAKALASGASECHIVDLKEELAAEYIWPMLKAESVYEDSYLLGTSVARPVIAKAQVMVARKVGADALAHGCTGKGNDQVRFESCFAALAPELKVIAPWREWTMRSREDLLNYLAERKIPTTASLTKIYSRDANLWHISTEGGELEDTWTPAGPNCWAWTVDPKDAPNEAEVLDIDFEAGVPVALNGEVLSGANLIERLNGVASAHGVGRVDIVENRLVGMKSRGCYETPAGTVLLAAHQALAHLVLDKVCSQHLKFLGQQFAQLLYDGRWFTPLREAIVAGVESLNKELTGQVRVELYKGQARVLGSQSPHSLFSEAFATFGADEVYNQKDAAGFIRLYSLPARIKALQEEGN
ncbi:argininosuccinate synthase [Gallaecimonas kandeliae]|uniref:argininosuccinate synthase n=1 Tax=Gallaecimonas kandeliae TaxID=3029055 RepID=UPI0026490293|nr:argininosuccinate synthase [Gallaecimonas kandeliae]WKE65295.1 argininosuccinate synthase [Gallaecimonas kandeliae]